MAAALLVTLSLSSSPLIPSDDPMVPELRGVYVARSGPHSGSEWLAQMLASLNISTFFQFDGHCSSQHAPEASREELTKLFQSGCDCLYENTVDISNGSINAPFEGNNMNDKWRKGNAFCTGQCSKSHNEACRGVAVIPSLEGKNQGSKAFQQHLDTIDWMASKKDGGVSWERTNAVKHAVSRTAARCRFEYKDNHNKDNATVEGFSVMQLDPEALLIRAQMVTQRLHNSHYYVEYAQNKSLDTSIIQYEAAQLDPIANMHKLLRTARMANHHIKLSFGSKMTPDDLRDLLLNFDEIDAYFEVDPCHQRMLRSPKVEIFDLCPWKDINHKEGIVDNDDEMELDLLAAREEGLPEKHPGHTFNCEGITPNDGNRVHLCAKAKQLARKRGKDPNKV